MEQPTSSDTRCPRRLASLGLVKEPVPGPRGPPARPVPAPLRRLLLALVVDAPHLIPVGVFLQVPLAAAARAEPEGQVVALLGPHVLPALLLVPGARAPDAVELDQDGALPLVETLQVHPVAVGAELVVADHPLVVVLLQVDGAGQGAAEGGRTLALWVGRGCCVLIAISPNNVLLSRHRVSINQSVTFRISPL